MVWNPDVEGSESLFIINCIASFFSLIGSLLMTYFCCRIERPWSIPTKLVLSIAISDIFYSIANIMSAFGDQGTSVNLLCYTEAVIRACSFVTTLLFATCLAVFCCKSTNFDIAWSQNQQKQLLNKTFLLGTVACLIFVLSPMIFPGFFAYKNGDFYCEIGSPIGSEKFIALMNIIVTELLPVLIAVLVTIAAYYISAQRMRQLPQELLDEMNFKFSKLLWYPTVLVLTFGPCITYALITKLFNSKGNLIVNQVHLLITHSIGLSNAIVYGLQKKREKVKRNVVDDDAYTNYSMQPVYGVEDETSEHSIDMDTQLRKTLAFSSTVSPSNM